MILTQHSKTISNSQNCQILAVLCLWWLEISAKFLLATQHSVHWRVLRLGGKLYYIPHFLLQWWRPCITQATTYHRHCFTLSHLACRLLLPVGKSTTLQLCHFTRVYLIKNTDYSLSRGWTEIVVLHAVALCNNDSIWLGKGQVRATIVDKLYWWLTSLLVIN